MDSILTSVKKMLGITSTDTSFDTDLIIHINSVLMILNQLGVGPSAGFSIEDATDEWEDFLPNGVPLEAVKSYVYLKVRMIFDPPLSSAVADAFNKNIAELEFRINVMVDKGYFEVDELESRVYELETKVDELEDKIDEHEELFKVLVGDSDES